MNTDVNYISNVLLFIGIIAFISLGCNIMVLIEYLYKKKMVEKVGKYFGFEIVAAEDIVECFEVREKKKCGCVSRSGNYRCGRKENHYGLHIATDYSRVLEVWKDPDVDMVDIVPESESEETQPISRKWTFEYRRGKR